MHNTLERCKQVGAHSHVVTREGITVAVRTFEVSGAAATRYEVLIEGCGLRAVLDLPVAEEELEVRIEQAVSAFFACARLRLSQQTPRRALRVAQSRWSKAPVSRSGPRGAGDAHLRAPPERVVLEVERATTRPRDPALARRDSRASAWLSHHRRRLQRARAG